MTTETRDYAREMCRALNGVVFDGDPDVVQPILDAACAAAVAEEREAWTQAVEAATGPTGGWLIGPAALLGARRAA